MNPNSILFSPPSAPPADDGKRQAKHTIADAPATPHLGVAGNTYTVLLSGNDTNGRYALIDMHVEPGGGPPPHRHDFEESFTLLEGQITFTCRGQRHDVHAGQTLHVPANAPHSFKNDSGKPARMLCICAPAGQEEMFIEIGVPVDGRTVIPPPATPEQQKANVQKALALADKYHSEFLKPD